MNIVEFLLERVEEEEAAARLADSSRWLPEDKGVTFEYYADDFHDGEAQARLTADTKANMNHIAMHSPAKVLEECAVKRAILQGVLDNRDLALMDPWVHASTHLFKDHYIRPLARVYRDHPDYDEVWG